MNPAFHTIDILIFVAYLLLIIGLGIWIGHRTNKKNRSAEDYFLASKSLPWWTIGASLIAANISAEQFIGMSGSGFAGGFAVASYEFMAALTLIIVAKFFLPVFIKQGIYTIPEFVERRYSSQLKTILAVFWLGLFIFVNLTSVLFLGGKAIDTIVGTGDGSLIVPAIIGLAVVAAVYSFRGGLSSVAWTDVLQVGMLIVGGIITTLVALHYVSPDGNMAHGVRHVADVAGDRFHLILSKDNPEFKNLPGIVMLVGGLWVANLYYWGFNQYIIQRALAAKSLPEAQKGLAFAAFLKLLIPFIVVVPGIIAYVMFTEDTHGAVSAFTLGNGALNNDNAYPWLISTFIPIGLKGLVLAALAAAIISSLASMLNSTATIFTMDIFKPYLAPKVSIKIGRDANLVTVGRIAAAVALIVACIIAPLLGNVGQMFQYIQEYTGLVSPGILALFLLGLFWKKTTNKGAITGVVLSIPIALALKFLPIDMPFLDQMFYTCILTMAIIVMVSLATNPTDDDPKAIPTTSTLFKTDRNFNIAAYSICVLLVVIYAVFW
ncbi:MAG: sodium/solute symporter [Bacteroidales bacterium]|nr:sodium/solute symporter [Bacteroidales bacterium]